MKNAFRQSRAELILFLAVNLTVLKSNAADASANASAYLVTPVTVESALFGSVIMSEDITGRVGIRLLGAGTLMLAPAAPARASVAAESETASSSKPATEKGMVGGEMVTNVKMGAESEQGSVSVIVSYD